MRLVLVISSLKRGGAEHVMTCLANGWYRRGWQVTIVTLVDEGEGPAFPLDEGIEQVNLGWAGGKCGPLLGWLNAWRRIAALREAISQAEADLVISFLYKVNIFTIMACARLSLPVVVAEHNDPVAQPVARSWRYLRRLLYPQAWRVVTLTARNKAYFSFMPDKKVRVIANPLSPAFLAAIRSSPRGEGLAVTTKRFVAMGRLSRQKGFDLLLEAFAESGLAAAEPRWELVIWGDGLQRTALVGQAERLGLAKSVSLPGCTERPGRALLAADCFVLSSRWEGYPCVLLEAMAGGLPVISFDCRTGPREIITDGIDGILVEPEDVRGLAAAMQRLAQSPDEGRQLGAAARSVTARHDIEGVLNCWDREVFSELATAVPR